MPADPTPPQRRWKKTPKEEFQRPRAYTSVVPFQQAAPGLFIVTYRTSEELDPQAQAPLVAELERACQREPAIILFDVGSDVARVDTSVPTFWLGVTERLAFRGLAVVTTSTLVRMAANAFRLATVARGKSMRVAVFDTLDKAKAWAAELKAANAA